MDPWDYRTSDHEEADEDTPDHRTCECGAKLDRLTGADGGEFHGYSCPNPECTAN